MSVFPNVVEKEIAAKGDREIYLASVLRPVSSYRSRWLIRVGRRRCVDDQVRVVEGSGAIERGRHRLLSPRHESGHEHQGKHNGRGRETKKRTMGADVGSRTDDGVEKGVEAGVCIHRVEDGEGPAREFPARSPNSY